MAARGLVNGRGPLEEWEGFSFENGYAAFGASANFSFSSIPLLRFRRI